MVRPGRKLPKRRDVRPVRKSQKTRPRRALLQMVFEWIADPKASVGGRLVPKTPRAGDGKPRRIDGVKYLTAAQAAAKTGLSIAALQRDWADTFAGMLGADADALISEGRWIAGRRDDLVDVSARVDVLTAIAAELKQDLQEVIAGKPLPRPQMMWRFDGRQLEPVAPRSPWGRPLVSDGKTYFSLAQAAAQLHKPIELLRRQWLQMFGDVLGDDAAAVRAAAAVDVAQVKGGAHASL
jgi:hypothetical protein